MYSDLWPSATWAVVDYYLEPKQAYYQMKKSYAPVLLTYVDTKDGLNLALINDTQKILTAKILTEKRRWTAEFCTANFSTQRLKAVMFSVFT